MKLKKLCRVNRAIVLTYDDGPSVSLTARLLRLLDDLNANASFFVLGRKAELSQATALLNDRGHEIGSHSYLHLNAWKVSPISVYRDIKLGFSMTRSTLTSDWFRPPYGKITLATLLQVWVLKRRFAWWTVDSTDTWKQPSPISAVLKQIRNSGGGVILLHDHDRLQHPEREVFVLEVTKEILNMAKQEHFKVCTLTELYGGWLRN